MGREEEVLPERLVWPEPVARRLHVIPATPELGKRHKAVGRCLHPNMGSDENAAKGMRCVLEGQQLTTSLWIYIFVNLWAQGSPSPLLTRCIKVIGAWPHSRPFSSLLLQSKFNPIHAVQACVAMRVAGSVAVGCLTLQVLGFAAAMAPFP